MKARLYWVGMIMGWFGITTPAHAERVRTLYANDRIVQPVFLSLGRSTILRFDEKPKNIVIGNQNYFSVEYIGNDVSIQPLGHSSTNIFVYTEFQTYGLILRVSTASQYDDLVYVKWRPTYISSGSSAKKGLRLVSEYPLNQTVEVPGIARLHFGKVLQTIAGASVVQFSVENLSSSPLAANEVEVWVSEKGQRVTSTPPSFQKINALAPKESAEMRILARITDAAQLTLTVRCRNQMGLMPQKNTKKVHLRFKRH